MLWTIINEADVFYSPKSICENNAVRSSDPYSYIKTGYHLYNRKGFLNRKLRRVPSCRCASVSFYC